MRLFQEKVKTKDGTTPLHHAVVKRKAKVLKLYMDSVEKKLSKDPYGTTPLHLAASHGKKGMVKLYLQREIGRAHV